MATDSVGSLYEDFAKNQPRVLPAGTYKVEIRSATLSPKENGISSQGRVLEGPKQGQLFWVPMMTLTPNSAPIFFQRMEGFSLGETWFAQFKGSLEDRAAIKALCEATAEQIKGSIVLMELGEDEWNGKPTNDFGSIPGVKYVGRKDAAGIVQNTAAPTPDTAESVQADATPQVPPPTPSTNGPPPPVPASSGSDSGDVPF